MKFILENESETPAYLRLYRQLWDDIVQGIYPFHTKLPSKRVIAADTGVSTITVEHAYALLCEEGYIESRERSGYFVIFREDDGFASAADIKQSHAAEGHHHTDTSEEFPFSVLAKTMRKVIGDLGESILERSPYRSYPSGVTASASKRHEYIRWAGEGGRYIVEDDFESEFSISKKPEETVFSHSSNENVIYMNTFSKTVSSSFRIGYMVIPKCLIQQFHEKLGFYSCTGPTFMQFVLAELINNGDFERHINRVRRAKRKNIK